MDKHLVNHTRQQTHTTHRRYCITWHCVHGTVMCPRHKHITTGASPGTLDAVLLLLTICIFFPHLFIIYAWCVCVCVCSLFRRVYTWSFVLVVDEYYIMLNTTSSYTVTNGDKPIISTCTRHVHYRGDVSLSYAVKLPLLRMTRISVKQRAYLFHSIP